MLFSLVDRVDSYADSHSSLLECELHNSSRALNALYEDLVSKSAVQKRTENTFVVSEHVRLFHHLPAADIKSNIQGKFLSPHFTMESTKHRELLTALDNALHDVCRSSDDIDVVKWVHNDQNHSSDLVSAA